MLRLTILCLHVKLFLVFASCPSDYPIAIGSNLCVYKSSNTENFCKAMKKCKDRGGELLRGEENFQALVQHGYSVIGAGNYYIGLTDMAEESKFQSDWSKRRKLFRWTDNTRRTSDANWNSGEPNDSGDEDGVHVIMSSAPKLNDHKLSTSLRYICQPLGPLPINRAYGQIPASSDTSTSSPPNDCADPEAEPSDPFSVASLRECAMKCSAHDTTRTHPQDGCQTFYFNEEKKKCLLVVKRNAKLDDNEYDEDPKWMRYG